MYKCRKNKVLLFLLLSFVYSMKTYGQTLQPPTFNFTFACANSGTNNFTVSFSYNLAFDMNNVFTIELSAPDGSFDDPTKNRNLGSITGENATFFVDRDFSFPADTYGSNYRIRIISSMPAIEGPPSDPFEAYFIDSTNPLVLNDDDGVFGNDVVLCGGGSKTLSVNGTNPDFNYLWFKINATGTDELIPGETGSSIEVSQPGKYYAAVDYGACTQTGLGIRSNNIDVILVNPTGLMIAGDNTVEICADETYEFEATVDDPSFVYQWFKDGTPITGLPDYSPRYTTPSSNQFGVYHVEINIGGCVSRSQDVTVQQKSGDSIDVDIVGTDTRVLLPGGVDGTSLEISHTAPAAPTTTIRWFRDGNLLLGRNIATIFITQPGVYFAEVIDDSGTCAVSKKSPEFTVLETVNLSTEIRRSTDYIECNTETTTLSIVGIQAEATDGNMYDLSPDQILLLNFQWFKDTASVPGATLNQLDINSYNDNGTYQLNVSVATLSSNSNELPVLLSLVGVEIQSSSTSNNLCPGETITLTMPIVSGFTYRWFKDGTELTVSDPSTLIVDEIGVYSVTFEGFGCLNNVPEVEIIEFDDSVLEVNPSSTAVLEPGETITLEASGADSYEWLNEMGDILSTNETVDINALGEYTLIGTVGTCRAERKINVVEDDGKLVIPNIVTPFNGDGINDTWELPNRFAFQTDVQVIIYDSRGREVLNTTDYQNNWPENNNLKDGMLFYFRVIRDNNLIKAGTISILQ